jgi:exosome complex RNA-binding protein Rrp42 (RNase PH superfamily)
MALRAALIDTRLPRVKAVIDGDKDDGRGGKNEMMGGEFGGAGGGMGGKNDLLVDGDISRARPPPGATNCPLIVTVSVLRAPLPKSNNGSAIVQYRSIPIVDARTEEEVCATTRVCVSVDPKGIVCGVHTLGGGGSALSDEEDAGCGRGGSLPLAMLGDVVTSAAMASRNLYSLLNDGDGRSCKTKDVDNDGGGYGYLLKNHFLIR